MARRMVAIRLTEESARRLIDLAARLGVSQAAVVELAIRWMDDHDAAMRAGHTGGAHDQTTDDRTRP